MAHIDTSDKIKVFDSFEGLETEIVNDMKSNDMLAQRYAVRFIMLNNFDELKKLAKLMAKFDVESLDLEELIEEDDEWITKDMLRNALIACKTSTFVVLETFVNKHPGNDYWVRFNCPEFTSLCPITGQPDFAEIRISYIPDVKMVESKSLKLYLFSFRNHGDFHEDCVNIIMKDLIKLMEPQYIEVTGIFTPRGGISIWPYANYGKPGTKYEKLAEQRFATHE